MALVLIIAAVFWLLTGFAGLERRKRLFVLAVLFGVVLLLQIILPPGNPLRAATGNGPGRWLGLAVIVTLVWLYWSWVRQLKTRAHQEIAPQQNARVSTGSAPLFSTAELQRYSRHIILHEIGGTGQAALKKASVLVVGAGGLGSPALQYLAAAGVGTLGVIDHDVVELSNLQRQVIHDSAALGQPKVKSAAANIASQNPEISFRPYHRRLVAREAETLFADYDLILDGCDNMETRRLVNQTCVALGKPLISAALTQWEGQIGLYHPASGAPCYACVFPQDADPLLVPSCAEAGVAGPLPGVVGAMMALEAVKWITGAGSSLAGRLLLYDALNAEFRVIKVKPNSQCKICGDLPKGPEQA